MRMPRTHQPSALLRALATLALLALVATACADGDDEDAAEDAPTATEVESSEAEEEPTEPAADTDDDATPTEVEVEATEVDEEATEPAADVADGDGDPLEAAYAGILGDPPTSAPEVTEGQSVWVVSCGESVITCSTPSQAVVDAAEAVGWEAQICDGQLNPQGWGDCVRQGVSAGTEAIITIGQDCVAIAGALGEAAAAGVTTINVGGTDCDLVGEDPLYSGVIPKLEGTSADDWWRQVGAMQADWIIGQTDGQASVLVLQFVDPLWGPWITEGFTARLETCEGCSIAAVLDITNQDVGGGQLVTKFSTALLEQGDANAIAVPLDGWLLAGLAQAIGESGRVDDLAVIGQGGTPANFDLIREGRGQDATVAFSFGWDGWSGVDALIRVLAGEEVVPAGVGMQVVDAERNLPEPGEPFRYEPAVDFEAAYLSAWNAS